MSIEESKHKEALGWYEKALRGALEPMDQALEAVEEVGTTLEAADVVGHRGALDKVTDALLQVQITLWENGDQIGQNFSASWSTQENIRRFEGRFFRSLQSMAQAIEALKAVRPGVEPGRAFIQYAQAQADAVRDLGHFYDALGAMVQASKEHFRLDEVREKAGRAKSKVWQAVQEGWVRAPKGEFRAPYIASAATGQAALKTNDQTAMVEAQAYSLWAYEVDLGRMLEAMHKFTSTYKQIIHSMG